MNITNPGRYVQIPAERVRKDAQSRLLGKESTEVIDEMLGPERFDPFPSTKT